MFTVLIMLAAVEQTYINILFQRTFSSIYPSLFLGDTCFIFLSGGMHCVFSQIWHANVFFFVTCVCDTFIQSVVVFLQVSSVEVVQAYIDRIQEVNPLLNAVVKDRQERIIRSVVLLSCNVYSINRSKESFNWQLF